MAEVGSSYYYLHGSSFTGVGDTQSSTQVSDTGQVKY